MSLHHSFEDPAAAPEGHEMETFRRVRGEMRDWLREFLEQSNALQGVSA